MQLSSRFANATPILRADHPLSDDQIRSVAPSIFAKEKHQSRSDRYTYIPTGEVLGALRKEGFQPFMVCQTRVRDTGKREHTKHMLRLRHAAQINGAEANEIILLNSHDGSSSYQMMSGQFRFVCANGLVCGRTDNDVRVRHKGDVVGDVIEGAQISILYLQLADNAATQGPGERAGRAAAEQGTKATAATVQTRAA